jgi:hypothetical protein
MARTVQEALSALLFALGFAAMAEQVKAEADTESLRLYARIIVKASAGMEAGPAIRERLEALGLM